MSDQSLERQGAQSLISVLKKYEKSFKSVLPKHLTADRWAWLCINSIRQTPKLCEVSAPSFINAVLLASNMGLEIRARSAYLVPFGKECQLLIDYRGKMELARRAGVGAISLELVHAGDEFDVWQDENGPHMRHRAARFRAAESGEVTDGYMSAQVNGSRQIEVMTLEEIEKIRKRSKSGAARPANHYGKELPGLTLADIRAIDIEKLPFRHPHRVPWVTDWDQMARKTVMHRGSNYLPQTAELMISQDVDVAVLGDKPMPQAPELTDFFEQLDPADDNALVAIPEGREEQSAAQADIVKQKTGKILPPGVITKLKDWAELSGQPEWVKVNNVVYHFDDEAGNYAVWQ